YLAPLTTGSGGGNDTLLPSTSTSSTSAGLIPLVSFTRGSWTNPTGLTRPELQRVTYALQNDRLVRLYSPVLDATMQDGTIWHTLLDQVKRMGLRFMDAGHNWQTQWPASTIPIAPTVPTTGAGVAPPAPPRLRPIAVELTLELDDWGIIVRHIE